MTTRVLDLLLEISIKGTPEAAKLKEAVDRLKASFTDLQKADIDSIFKAGNAQKTLDVLDATINRMKAAVQAGWKLKVDIDPTTLSSVDKILFGVNQLEKGIVGLGKTKVDFNLDRSKAEFDLLVSKVQKVVDLLAVAKQTKVDFDVSAANKSVDLLLTKARAIPDLLLDLRKTPLDLNLSKANRDLQQMTASTRELFALFKAGKIDSAEFTRLNAILNGVQQQARGVVFAIRDAGRQARDTGRDFSGLGSQINYAAREFLLLRRAAYGLGLVTIVREVLQLVQAFDQARQALKAVFGADEAATQFEFIRVEAERLGLSVTELAKSYAKFSAAGRALGLEQQLVKDNFLAVAEAGAILALSSQEVEGALVAIQQIASKGKLSLEELRQQLGDRIPGAISIAAKGLGLTEAKLFSLVEQGKITSKQFLETFPAALRASFGTDTNTRVETTTAAITRLQNQLKLLIDEAIRAGALDVLINALKSLTQFAADPATVKWLSEVSAGFKSLTVFLKENADAIVFLIKAYLGFKALTIVTSIINGIAASLVAFTAASTAAAAGAAPLAARAAVLGGQFLILKDSLGAIAVAVSRLGSLLVGATTPLGLMVVAAGGAAVALRDYAKGINAAKDAAELGADAQERFYLALDAGDKLQTIVDDLEDYRGAAKLTAQELSFFGAEGLRAYKAQVEGAKLLAEAEKGQAEQLKVMLNLELKGLEGKKKRTDEDLRRISDLKLGLEEVAAAEKKAADEATALSTVLKDISKVAINKGISFDPYLEGLQKFTQGSKEALDALKGFERISFDDLSTEQQGLIKQLDELRDKGQSTTEIFKKIIPHNFAEGGIEAISSIGKSLAYLEQQGTETAKVLSDQVAAALDKLDGEGLRKFGINAQAALDSAKISAQAFSILLEGQLKAALKNLGVDADNAGSKVSRAFKGIQANLDVVAGNAKATGAQIKASLDVAINAAKTKEELKALQQQVKDLGISAGKMGKEVDDSLTRLDDKARIAAQTMDSALGDSFGRLGVKSKEVLDAIALQADIDFKRIKDSGTATAIELAKAFEKTELGESFARLGVKARSSLKAIADQAVQDFNRIKASGDATTLEIEAAFRKMAEEVTKANNGIPPISITIQAVDFNAFDLIVKAAETAADRTRAAIENAIPLAKTTAQLQALSDAIKIAFDKGKISAAEFGEMVTKVGFQIRDMAAKPVGELAAAADLLGLKTKDQLQATADNAKQAFDIITSSGQFSAAELSKAAQQYLDAYKAANNGVIDAFDPAIAKALELVNATNQAAEAASNLASSGGGSRNAPANGINLRDQSLTQLQAQLQETLRTYRELGVTNVQDLQIVQEIQKEINRQGAENSRTLAENAKKLNDAANDALNGNAQKASEKPKAGGLPGGGIANDGFNNMGGQTINFNFNGSGTLTPDAVKRQVAPVLATTAKRRQ